MSEQKKTPDEFMAGYVDHPEEEYELDDEDEFESFDCHAQNYKGVWTCGKVGSEECDFECPFARIYLR